MKLTYNPRIIKHLGTELITKDEIAISELIKNSYDAKSKKVNIHFFDTLEDIKTENFLYSVIEHIPEILKECSTGKIIVVEDLGSGMDHDKLKSAFFEVGTTSKKDEVKDEEILLGQKGIGRLSAQRIAPILLVESSNGDGIINLVKVDWEKFSKDLEYDAPEYRKQESIGKSFTRLWLLSNEQREINFSNFFEVIERKNLDMFDNPYGPKLTIKRITPSLQTAMSFLFSPFEKGKKAIELKFFHNNQEISSKLNFDALKIAEAEYTFDISEETKNDNNTPEYFLNLRMKLKPWFLERLHRGWVKDKLLISSYIREHHFYKQLLDDYHIRYENNLKAKVPIKELNESQLESIGKLMPVKGVVYAFKRNRALVNMAVRSAIENNYLVTKEDKSGFGIQEFLEENNGIKLYRNQFRIATLGNKDNDWLELQQKRTKGQQFYRFELGNVIGYVSLNDPKQKYIEETSSREHLNENEATTALYKILDYIFNVRFYDFTRKASLITEDILKEKELIPKTKQKVVDDETQRIKTQLEKSKTELSAFKEAFSALNKNIDLDTPDKIESTKRVLSELSKITDSYYSTMNASVGSIGSIEKILAIAREEQNRVKVDAYNNYKLMANGLITETITHEFHSIMKNQTNDKEYKTHFRNLNDCLIKHKESEIRKNDLRPIESNYKSMHKKFEEIELFYEFLEKTFIYKGTVDEFVKVNVRDFIQESILKRYESKLNEYHIELQFENANIEVLVPKGSLVHIFYNLIENSIYWIAYRQRQSLIDSTFKRSNKDFIEFRKADNATIQVLDSGIGVKENMQHTLFQPLQSGKEDGGRGMGLYIVSNFLESFDSNIRLKEDLNEFGNRYIFELEFNQ